ncbi:SDR family oxidoreductase [Pseudomonas sp. BW7P1]|uniref:SDR family oxidoreductase n=1 Tax=Pseudomonas TaxID=286 RepID=UPI0021AD89FA|nr:SDR family NAD(P)-dependent oxidoreductase [Pseudomonas sp. BW7P1]UWI59808.1 SDR family NAD(P)-dependent oxidoreductase [Pseudomonas sp. BW7P1]
MGSTERNLPPASGKRVFITGVSSGIGEALAELHLRHGYTVFGTSRREPYRFMTHPNFRFRPLDLSKTADIGELFKGPFAEIPGRGVDVLFLNAGVSGNVPARGEEFSLAEVQHVLNVNVLANKAILDLILTSPHRPATCVLSASMAGVRFRAGTLTYSLSKAALAALGGVYAEENPDIFFAVLGLCNVDTGLSRQVSFSQRTADFPDLQALQQRALAPGYMISAAQRAEDIREVIGSPADYGVKSGVFVDMRTVLTRQAKASEALPQT